MHGGLAESENNAENSPLKYKMKRTDISLRDLCRSNTFKAVSGLKQSLTSRAEHSDFLMIIRQLLGNIKLTTDQFVPPCKTRLMLSLCRANGNCNANEPRSMQSIMHKTGHITNRSIPGCTILQLSASLTKERLCQDELCVDRNKEDFQPRKKKR